MRRVTCALAGALLATFACASAQAADAPACGSGSHAIVGRLQGAAQGLAVRLGVLPDAPLGERYLSELRAILAARTSPGEALALVMYRGDFAATASNALATMRRVDVAADGSFRCAGLPAGRYLAIAFVSQGTGAARTGLDPRSMQIFAASATVGATFDAAIVGWTHLGGTP
jgi:hypothetical protein